MYDQKHMAAYLHLPGTSLHIQCHTASCIFLSYTVHIEHHLCAVFSMLGTQDTAVRKRVDLTGDKTENWHSGYWKGRQDNRIGTKNEEAPPLHRVAKEGLSCCVLSGQRLEEASNAEGQASSAACVKVLGKHKFNPVIISWCALPTILYAEVSHHWESTHCAFIVK